jgi:hypothetical protein
MHRPRTLLLALAMSLASGTSAAQTADSLRAAIAATRAQSAAAARVFLDSTRTAAERERAAAPVAAFLDRADARAALALVDNPREPARIRLIALTRGAYLIDGDTAAESALLRWVADRKTPGPVREAAMNTLTAMLVGSTMRARRLPEITGLLRELSAEPDSVVRRPALAWLVVSGDSGTVSRLVRSLTPGGDPVVTPLEAVVMLANSGRADAKAAVRPLLDQRRDVAARTEAIRVLGADRASAPALDRLVADSTEADTVRAAALGAVFANRPHDFPSVSLPLVADEKAREDLRVFAIEAVTLRTRAPSPEMKIVPPNSFTEVVRRLAKESASPRVRAAAANYLREQEL